ARRARWAWGAGRREVGGAAAGAGRADRGGDPPRAGHSAGAEVGAEVDVEPVLAEQPARRGGCLRLAAVGDPGLVEPGVGRPGSVGVFAVDARPLGALGCTRARLDRLGFDRLGFDRLGSDRLGLVLARVVI